MKVAFSKVARVKQYIYIYILYGNVSFLHGSVSMFLGFIFRNNGVFFVHLYCHQCCCFYIITVAVNFIVIIIIICISDIIVIIIVILALSFCFTLISMLSLLLVYYQTLLYLIAYDIYRYYRTLLPCTICTLNDLVPGSIGI